MNRHMRTGAIALAVMLATLSPNRARAEVQWPATELGRHARAWFEQMKGSEADARAFFATHFAPEALKQTPLEARLERRRGLIERTGGLVPVEVLASTETSLSVRARQADGEEPVALFEAEAAPPHRILGVRLELGGPGGGGPPPPAGPPLTEPEAVKAIRARLDEGARAGTFSGAVLVARAGQPVLRQAWGVADREKGTPLTPETRFNLASLGKILTKTAVAQLAQAGKLSLDDKLSKYLPDFPRANDITIDMLVNMSSGVGDIFNDRYRSMDRSKLRHNRDYLELIRDQPLWFEPGTGNRYSNGGYVLLGEAIAKASGQDYYDYLAAHVCKPAGMTATAALLEGDGTPGVARGYTHEGAAEGQERDNAATRPARGSAAGGSYSTLDDMLALDQALTGARLVNAGWSDWVMGGPRPGQEPVDPAALPSPGFGFAGGAPGISTEWFHDGPWTIIILTNRDPEVSRPFIEAVEAVVRRVGA